MKPLVPEDRIVPWQTDLPKSFPIIPLKYLLTINPSMLSEETPLDYQIRYIDISSVSSHGEITDVTVMPFRDAPSRARRIRPRGRCSTGVRDGAPTERGSSWPAIAGAGGVCGS